MDLDHRLCYRAVAARDRRFDGRIFTAVLTTGVYCRPVCPARTPAPGNVRFYATAAAAEAAGFRPCRRCRPQSAPGSAAWLGSPATVARALRLIADGALDRSGTDRLAADLGLGSRQLRRLFARHLGVAPLRLAQTRRLHFAQRLLDETTLPVGRIATACGYGSVRRFQAAYRHAYGAPPTALRRARPSPPLARAGTAPAAVELRLPYRPPLDWAALVAFLAPRAVPGVERVEPAAYRRAVRAGDRLGVIEVRPAPAGAAHLLLVVPPALAPALLDLHARARRLFDLDADPAPIADALGRDPLLVPSVRRHPGLRLPGAWDPFELLVRAILGQQVSVAAATTLAGRIAARWGEEVAAGHRLFPTPDALGGAELESVGLPRARAEAIRAAARAAAAGGGPLGPAPSLDEALAALTALPGVGRWTAAYVAMRALGEPDAFPAGDLGLGRAAGNLGEPELLARAEAWRPWRGYAAMHLWHGLAGGDRPAGRARRSPSSSPSTRRKP
jgi:AraC family transcriptional regulator of adaptative response / DNA-3-methyladenine glycosylase II